MLELFYIAITFGLGLLFGSFTNVIICRLPVGESIIFPSSHCPHCNEPLKARDLVPVLSWLFLKGRCRYCDARISPRYPWVEILCAFLFIGVYLRWGLHGETITGWVFTVILLAAAIIDLDHGIIPDHLTYPGIVIGLILSCFTTLGLLQALGGTLVFGGLLYLVLFLSNGGMGGGDVKMAAMIGAFTGLAGSAVTIMLASLAGAIFGSILIAVTKSGRKTPIRFGPFLAVAAYIAYLYADTIVLWYLGSFFPG